MSWLWIYITLMEWVGIVLVVKALGDEQYHIEPKKAGVYFLGICYIMQLLCILGCLRYVL